MEDEELQDGYEEPRNRAAEARQMRKAKSNAAADRTVQTLDNAANIAQFTPAAGYAKAYKTFRSIDNNLTGGKASRALSKVANKTAPGMNAINRIGSSGLLNNANKALAAKDKLSGKGGSSTPSAPKVKTSTSGGPSATGGANNTANASSGNSKKELEKEKKKQNGQSDIGNSSSESKDTSDPQSSSLSVLIGEVTPTKILVICVVAFLFFFVFVFVTLFNSIGVIDEMHSAMAYGEISTSSKSTSASYSVENINIMANADRFSDDDYDFKELNQEYTPPAEGTVSDTRDNSKRDTLLSWAKKIFPSSIYLTYFDLGNKFSTQGKCSGEECNERAEVKFYQKTADIAYRYRKLYHVELDWPLIVATITINSVDKESTFAANLSSYKTSEVNNIKETMSLDWDYDYEKMPGYEYLSPYDARYDLQILAKNMVKKKTIQTCSDTKGNIVKKLELEDIKNSKIEEQETIFKKDPKKVNDYEEDEIYYLVCTKGTKYAINSTYTLDKDKYKEFLTEFIEKRYYLNGSTNGSEGSSDGYGPSSSMGNGSWGWPLPDGATRCRSSIFGPRIHPIYKTMQNHSGDDYPAATGTPVFAVADGVVTSIYTGCVVGDMSCGGKAGNHVVINHGNGVTSVYMHASQVLVSKGQQVSRGQEIMKVGSTGSSTGAHLHITFKENGTPVAPSNYIGALPAC